MDFPQFKVVQFPEGLLQQLADVFFDHAGIASLKEIADPETGPLAEAEALADVMEVLAVDKLDLRDHSLPTLSHMLAERLNQVRTAIEASAFSQVGAA